MSFSTSLTYYRPCAPPTITADDLARFISQLRDTGILTDDGFQMLHVKFGDSIDQDEQGTSWEEEISPCMFISHDIEWDVDLYPSGLQDIIERLTGDDRRIHRALASLGGVIDAVLQPITRTNSPENERDFCPDSLWLEFGPVETYHLAGEAPAVVGWIGVSLSGDGLLFPWTFRDVVDRLEATPEIQCMMNSCRSFWPVPPEPPEPRIVALRSQIGELWPYKTIDKPGDWYWGLKESG